MSQTGPTLDTPQTCPHCGSAFTVRALLEASISYWPELNVVFSTLPCCNTREELQLEAHQVWRGYVYAAGAPHFCAMEAYAAPNLQPHRIGPNALRFALGGREWEIHTHTRQFTSSTPPQPMPSQSTDPFFLRNALAAVQAQDWETLESLRSDIRPEHVPEIVKSWRPTLPWPIKDAYATLLMDQTGDAVRPVMEEALNSPTPETRAYALCSLSGNFDLFDSLLTSSMVDARLVDAAIQRYRASRR